MTEALRRLQSEHDFEIVVVDIDNHGDEAMLSRYDELVPVLLDGRTEICHYHLDPQAVIACLIDKGFGNAAKTLESARETDTL
jgi:Ni2+-binding GTPase involved in maturation of urease and hydrogenase